MSESSDTAKARAMRKALTPPEARMWLFLKSLRSKGCHFRRQVPFRGYFLDFACHTNRLVIETDGLSHLERGAHDALRDGVLAREGYRTLRFPNRAIRDEFHFVQDAILAALADTHPTLQASPAVPPHKGEGE